MSAVTAPPADGLGLHLRNVSKTFYGQIVLKNVNLDIAPGEVHGLVGQNGSGKSTLIKILAGYHQPADGAQAWLNGEELGIGTVPDGVNVPIRFVHQDLALILELNAIDNVALGGGYVKRGPWLINWAEQREVTVAALARFGVNIDPDANLASVTPVERTAVAIVRALAGWQEGSGMLILDEPTASLPSGEVERLHQIVREVSGAGAGVVYVSHRLDDVVHVADRISVLREGELVGTYESADVDTDRLASLMVGRRVEHGRRPPHDIEAQSQVVMTARAVSGRWLRGLDLAVRRGEIVGIAGVLGSGREELPYALASAASVTITGDVEVDGHHLVHGSPRAAQKLGIGFVPADRAREAVVGPFRLRENLVLPGVGQKLIGNDLEFEKVNDWMERVGIVPKDSERSLLTFSGGNQQKVIIARMLNLEPKVLVLAEPTAGVDIGAREAIFELLKSASEERGLAVVVASSDIEDLVAMCHRVVVLWNGRALYDLVGEQVQSHNILRAMEGLDVTQSHQEGELV